MIDRIPIEMSQKVVEYLKNKTRWDWKRIANLVGVAESTLQRIRKGEIGLSLQQLSNLVERMGPDVISIPKDVAPELKELYGAYREIVLL